MSTTLGEKLRQAREERGISISEVAEQTRISSLYLKSIEEDNYKPLPGGIFNKGFVKSYAKYVGLDEQEALQDYARAVASAEQPLDNEPPRYRPEVLTDDRSTSSLAPTIIFAVIILGLMTGGILFVVNYIQNQSETVSGPTNSSGNASNVASNLGGAVPTPPAANEIKVEFKVLSDKVSVTSTVDGVVANDEVTPASAKTFTARQSLKLRYYRGFADRVQILLNGKQITPPPPPAKGNIEFEINRENAARIFESGQIVEGPAPASPTPQATPTAVTPATPDATRPVATPPPATPRPTATIRPAFTPAATPRRTPTPIIVDDDDTPRPRPTPQ